MVSLVCRIPVGICVGVEEEVGAIETVHKGRVIGSDTVRVEQLPRVVGIVTGGLQPNGEEVFVEALSDEFGVSAYAALAIVTTLKNQDRSKQCPYHKAGSHPSH